MKQFTTVKIGYSAGVYGCSGEYFTTIYNNGTKTGSFSFGGLYGSEERIAREMVKKGFKEYYTQSFYGQMKGYETKYIQSEGTAIEYVKSGFKKA